ncbi:MULTISPECIES: HAD-IIIC family phosphatase [Methylosinus]|uniref:FkbH like protein n=1 Tax=Methylosinus trichosporium (strain ATCC 35070 / NCIMB 11131 / UNIQEM 75 / OB3b) TaxID=595536 RepID=A0A2D2D7N3_METT3|nr:MULTISPECIES: HAD-IIIC family phosphatase [Methylosinus]ATQ70962.1 FkbH like protein [Methylosinus trichosporium OB3b]OBS54398.1 FkbH like protein [Methylosinus sp. 3S-1]
MQLDAVAQTKAARTNPLAELRALKRAGVGEAAGRIRELLTELEDALDLDAAGALLSGEAERAALAAAEGFRTQRIALLGSSTLDTVPNLLTALLARAGVAPTIRSAGFNQWRFEIMAGAPNLKDLAPRLVACLLDDQAVFEEIADPLDLAAVEARCKAFPAELGRWIDACRAALGGRVILCTIPLSPLRRERIVDYRGKARLAAAWERMNAGILALAEEQPGTVVLAADALAAHATSIFAPDRMRHIAGHAFTPDFLRAYAAELARVARADLGLAKKCLVLDLDNTLWGGVVGDDGVAGLRLGGAYPGSAYRELQIVARDLVAQGVMLTICSKNDEAIAREAIETHPEMALRPEHFVAMTADWSPKPDNIRRQAEKLNIGIDAMVFVDDNPVERGAMRALAPQVTTVELPADPASYATVLLSRGDFNLLELTDEDRERVSMYRAQSAREELAAESASLEDYLVGLDSQLAVEPLDRLNAGRIAQLFAKTNQFNLTGRRFGDAEIETLRADGVRFFGARLSDRFGDNGLIAALALGAAPDGAWTIENFVLSCRVFSRNVEGALVTLVLRAARERNAPAVDGSFVETAKNKKFADFYRNLGFVETDGRFRHDLEQFPEWPRWIRVVGGEEAFHAR